MKKNLRRSFVIIVKMYFARWFVRLTLLFASMGSCS